MGTLCFAQAHLPTHIWLARHGSLKKRVLGHHQLHISSKKYMNVLQPDVETMIAFIAK